MYTDRMSGNQTLILADDLTGANDTAIQFVKQDFSALVIIRSDSADSGILEDYDVISINTNSRGMNPDDAYRAVYGTMKRLGFQKGCFVYKKVDSVLRGNPGRELAAVMDALDIPLALAAPSFPANRSVLEKGRLYAGGNTGSGGIDAVQIFAEGTGRKTENIPLDEIRKGLQAVVDFIIARNNNDIQVFVADAVNDEDLEIVYRASTALGRPHILAGSAGMANQFARDMGKAKAGSSGNKPPVFTPPLSPVLVIAGTRQGETAVQISTLSRAMPVPVIRFRVRLIAEGKTEAAITEAYDEAVVCMQENAKLCIIAVESMFRAEVPVGELVKNYAEGDDASAAISEALGILTGKLCDAFKFPVILSTGGDTSLGICRSLGINGIEPLAEICPGIPLGRIADGAYAGRFIITKSGRFGNPNSLVEILNYLGVAQ
ncbi:MAG: hypothetical protein LBD55_04025 [Treponema sp.]|jgi:uncharacterized protein YgbK (DUF1537 family)|nr:hypothetical protein [Treponema sp.]